MRDDPYVEVLGPLWELRERIEATLAKHGLTVLQLNYSPGPPTDGPHEVQVLATLAPQAQPPRDDGFEEVILGARAAELEAQVAKAQEELRRSIGNGGFL